MVYNGKPYWNGWFGGTMIFGNIQIFSYDVSGVVSGLCASDVRALPVWREPRLLPFPSWQIREEKKHRDLFKVSFDMGFSMVHYQQMVWYSKKMDKHGLIFKKWINILQKIAWYYKNMDCYCIFWYLLILVLAFFSCCSLLGKLIEFVIRGDAILCVQ